MKPLFFSIFLFLFANSAFATNLCDTSCNLTISFPTGGSIEATEALTLTFGTDGVLDLGATGTINTAVQPSSTDFSAGGTLALAVGESITFDVGGSLDLGTGGNFDYTNITIMTDGLIEVVAVGGDETIFLGSLTISGIATVNVSGIDITIDYLSAVDATITLNATGSIVDNTNTQNTCTTSASSGMTIISGVSDPVLVDADLCTVPDSSGTMVISGTTISSSGSIAVTGPTTISNTTPLVTDVTLSTVSSTVNTAQVTVSLIDNSTVATLDPVQTTETSEVTTDVVLVNSESVTIESIDTSATGSPSTAAQPASSAQLNSNISTETGNSSGSMGMLSPMFAFLFMWLRRLNSNTLFQTKVLNRVKQ
ncbi:MAG: hypothetical protein OEZ15_05230 [Gammaproteobacteria bacterium]|nr:hypothetical protein [Gammaproteobacteria bacterium]